MERAASLLSLFFFNDRSRFFCGAFNGGFRLCLVCFAAGLIVLLILLQFQFLFFFTLLVQFFFTLLVLIINFYQRNILSWELVEFVENIIAPYGRYRSLTESYPSGVFMYRPCFVILFPQMELSQNIHLLGDLLGKVISELESPQLFEIEERIRALAKARRNGDSVAAQKLQDEVSSLKNEDARVIAAAFAAYFDLVNLAEELQ